MMVKTMGSDFNNIWDSFRLGDQKALETIYRTHYSLLINYGYKFTRDRSLIEEAIQTLFIKMWNNRKTLNKPASLKHYIIKAFRNTLVRALERSNKKTALFDTLNENSPAEQAHDEKIIFREESGERELHIKKIMEALTNRQREAIFLRFYSELSYEEIAVVMNMNVGGVYKLIYRAIDRLRENK